MPIAAAGDRLASVVGALVDKVGRYGRMDQPLVDAGRPATSPLYHGGEVFKRGEVDAGPGPLLERRMVKAPSGVLQVRPRPADSGESAAGAE